MLDSSDKSELINYTVMFSLYLFGSGVWFFIHPFFDGEYFKYYIGAFFVEVVLIIAGWFYFSTREKLSLSFLLWGGVLSIYSLGISITAILTLWTKAQGDTLGVVVIFILLMSVLLFSFFVRIFEPKSNFKSGIKKGRFMLGTYKFNSAVWQKDVSEDNPVYVFFGMNKTKNQVGVNSFTKTVRSGGRWAAIVGALGLIITSVGGSGYFETLVITIGSLGFGYIFAFTNIADLYFCLKAGFSNQRGR